ncbi:MAG: hypothetical protein LBS84_12130 [Clostridiales bacterium]|jgi:hypothetical protein|nr:hypothetical protein [Clostridiales bacterium]
MNSFESLAGPSKKVSAARQPARPVDTQPNAAEFQISSLVENLVKEFYSEPLASANAQAPEEDVQPLINLQPIDVQPIDVQPEPVRLFEERAPDLGGIDTELEAENKAAAISVQPGIDGLFETEVSALRQAKSAEREAPASLANNILEINTDSDKPYNKDVDIPVGSLRGYGINIDNRLPMREFVDDTRIIPGNISEIMSVVETYSDAAANEIEELLRKLCLDSDDPMISNKGLYTVQYIRKRRGQEGDGGLISAMIAREEKMINELRR